MLPDLTAEGVKDWQSRTTMEGVPEDLLACSSRSRTWIYAQMGA